MVRRAGAFRVRARDLATLGDALLATRAAPFRLARDRFAFAETREAPDRGRPFARFLLRLVLRAAMGPSFRNLDSITISVVTSTAYRHLGSRSLVPPVPDVGFGDTNRKQTRH